MAPNNGESNEKTIENDMESRTNHLYRVVNALISSHALGKVKDQSRTPKPKRVTTYYEQTGTQ